MSDSAYDKWIYSKYTLGSLIPSNQSGLGFEDVQQFLVHRVAMAI